MAQKTMRELAIWLGGMQVELFETNQPVYMDVFCSGDGIRKIICEYYDALVREEKIPRIEDLSPDDKKLLKLTALEIAAMRLDTAGCVQLCKCLSVLNYHKTLPNEYAEISTAAAINEAGSNNA